MYRVRCLRCKMEWEQCMSPYSCLYCESLDVRNITPPAYAPSWKLEEMKRDGSKLQKQK